MVDGSGNGSGDTNPNPNPDSGSVSHHGYGYGYGRGYSQDVEKIREVEYPLLKGGFCLLLGLLCLWIQSNPIRGTFVSILYTWTFSY